MRPCAALEQAGFAPIKIALEADGEAVTFQLGRVGAVRRLDEEQMLRRLITTFRSSGFNVGFTEVVIVELGESVLHGMSLVGPLETVCQGASVPVEA